MTDYRMEAYFAIDGGLRHGTIVVEAESAEEAEERARDERIRPADPSDIGGACDDDHYPRYYYDIEHLEGDERGDDD